MKPVGKQTQTSEKQGFNAASFFKAPTLPAVQDTTQSNVPPAASSPAALVGSAARLLEGARETSPLEMFAPILACSGWPEF